MCEIRDAKGFEIYHGPFSFHSLCGEGVAQRIVNAVNRVPPPVDANDKSSPKGDCLRQCIARVLGLRPSRVPDFVNLHKGYWYHHLQKWCERKNILIVMGGHTSRGLPAVIPQEVKTWISIGKTHSGSDHAIVVGENGVGAYNGGIPLKKPESFIVLYDLSIYDE